MREDRLACCMRKQAARELTNRTKGEYDSDGEEPDGDNIPRSIAKAAKYVRNSFVAKT